MRRSSQLSASLNSNSIKKGLKNKTKQKKLLSHKVRLKIRMFKV
jgi:hypothetical protein